MTSLLKKTFLGFALLVTVFVAHNAFAQTYYYGDQYPYGNTNYNNQNPYYYPESNQYFVGQDNNAIIAQLLQIIEQLKLGQQFNYTFPPYNSSYYTFTSTYGGSGSGDILPSVETLSARDVQEDSAELRGEVDMNDYRDGIVFFVYGQDEDMIEDVEDDYDSYEDVEDDEEDDDFEVVRVERGFDGSDDFKEDVDGLESDERYYFIICVEYEDYDNDERLECGDVEDFETDDDNNGDNEPEVETYSADDIRDDSAELRGYVDMNDYDDGRVFFVYGEDEGDVEDVEDEDSYSDIDEHGDDLQKVSVGNNFDGSDDFNEEVDLDNNTRYYFRICVEYQDNNDDTLECGDVRDFETD